jgi:hypothetical protein
MTRARLHNRRPNETFDLEFEGARYAVTVGYYLDGRPGEVFAHGAKTGSAMDALLDDACVAVSLLLQHGVSPAEFAASMSRIGDQAPASIIGAIADLLTEVAA